MRKMAIFTAAAMTFRKGMIIRGLRDCGANSPETAKTLKEADVINPDGFPEYTESLVQSGVINKTEDGRYWVAKRQHS